MTGVPESVLVTQDFMMVRPELVRLLGGANEALVWTRIEYRARGREADVDSDGVTWWTSSRETLAEDVGISVDQVRRVLEKLVRDGYLEDCKLRSAGNYDQRKSYRALVDSARSMMAPPPNEQGVEAPSAMAPPPNEQGGGPQSSLLDVEDVEDKYTDVRTSPEGVFEEVWKFWPRKESKKKALDKFKLLLPLHPELPTLIRDHGEAHGLYSGTYVPYLISWLNAERWNDPLPQPQRSSSSQQDRDLALIARYSEGGDQRALEA